LWIGSIWHDLIDRIQAEKRLKDSLDKLNSLHAIDLVILARKMEDFRHGVILHDIGKILIPDSIMHVSPEYTRRVWISNYIFDKLLLWNYPRRSTYWETYSARC
jgi:hypothetical protein